MATPLLVNFTACTSGQWRIQRVDEVIGESLPAAERLLVSEGAAASSGIWNLSGVTSNTRYANRNEVGQLRAMQEGLGRPLATRAALIPIRKTQNWWELAQDERRVIFEEQSKHIAIGLEYLPGVARRLHHCRDLIANGHHEPFDFLTWFEYAPGDSDAFEMLVQRLRETPEWRYVDREVDIRLIRD